MDEAGRRVFREGMKSRGRRAFHDYLRDARDGGGVYYKVAEALREFSRMFLC